MKDFEFIKLLGSGAYGGGNLIIIIKLLYKLINTIKYFIIKNY